MEQVEYPQRKCREAIYNDVGLAYPCELVLLHPGPCATFSSHPTVTRRDAWEKAHPDWRKDIGQMDDIV